MCFSPGSRKLQVYKENLTDLDPNTLLPIVKCFNVLMDFGPGKTNLWTEPLDSGISATCTETIC